MNDEISRMDDLVTLYEIARVALTRYPDQIADELDISDDEVRRLLKRVREILK